MIKVKKLHRLAKIPKYAHDLDAGADLSSVEDIIIPPLSRQIVRTGISIEISDPNVYARIAPRSGLAVKNGIDVMAGVIDAGYRGEVCVVLFNSDQHIPFEVKCGDRIAQIIIEQYMSAIFIESDELVESNRSNNGFGSSGINSDNHS